MKCAHFALMVSIIIGFPAVAASERSPYAGQESRAIKALSDEEVQGYRSGKGMGLAKAAELNGYPGPAHVLELAAHLDLTPEQRARTEVVFKAMQDEAVSFGRKLIDEERKLDRQFAAGSITPETLQVLLEQIGALQGKVRAVHLQAHLAQLKILTPEQRARYAGLRGYANADSGAAPAHRHH
jgi:Spy/CpxP family protein refolding chaperone